MEKQSEISAKLTNNSHYIKKPNNTMKKVNYEEKDDSNNHLPSLECINNCLTWKLVVKINNSININREEHSFFGNSIYFIQFHQSILNILKNPSILTHNLKHKKKIIQNQSEKKRLFYLLLSESNKQLNSLKSENMTNNMHSIDEMFPIDNSQFNYMIIDSNLGVKDNLKNIFFLIFELNQTPNNIFEYINEDLVKEEVHFTLNGKFHGVEVFKKDITFSIEYQRFIKCMQIKLQSYYNNKIFQGQKKKLQNINKKELHFYSKILTNKNIGIEFTRRFTDENELKYTNFNSVVHSSIIMNRIYLELTIPQQLINKNEGNIAFNQNCNILEIKNPLIAVQRDFVQMRNNQKEKILLRNNFTVNKNKVYIKGYIPQHFHYNYYNNSTDSKQNIYCKFDDIERSLFNLNKNKVENNNEVNNDNNMKTQNIFLNEMSNLSNFEIFIDKATPIFAFKENLNAQFKEMNLLNFFSFYINISLFGMRVDYFSDNILHYILYSPTLSSLEISIKNQEIINQIILYLRSTKKLIQTENTNIPFDIILREYFQNILLKVSKNEIKLTFTENNPFYCRKLLIKQIQIIFNIIPFLKDLTIKDIDINKSNFSLLFSPLKSNKEYFHKTSFVLFYSFKIENNKLKVVGALPIKLENKNFLNAVGDLSKEIVFPTKASELLKEMITNAYDEVISKWILKSYDYENYLKNNYNIQFL